MVDSSPHSASDATSKRPVHTEDVLLKMIESHFPVSLVMDLSSIAGPDSNELYRMELAEEESRQRDMVD